MDNSDKTKVAEPIFESSMVKTERTKQNQVPQNLQHRNETNSNTTVALENSDLKDLDEQIKSMMTMTDVRGTNGRLLASCNICGKQTTAGNMPAYIEANHITGVSHSCEMCGKVSRSRDALRKHKQRDHPTTRILIKYFCFQDKKKFGRAQV